MIEKVSMTTHSVWRINMKKTANKEVAKKKVHLFIWQKRLNMHLRRKYVLETSKIDTQIQRTLLCLKLNYIVNEKIIK